MPDAWIINASPLILFARINRLDLFGQLAPNIHIPATVLEEVSSGAAKDSSAHRAIAWAKAYQCPNIPVPPSVERWDLGPGETQVIARCLAGNFWAVLDDRMARRCISAHNLNMIGSLGVILRAKDRGLIDTAKPWVYKLREAGMYVSEELIQQALAALGEGP
ncbi:MAG: hypothetical protein A2286_01730 [Gammaproteobacteria bacterium RIFOXYA12_FULL_61_12]|nr:MAG: hypothetical protein A2286_01730 [Gammaproteobacteria bacterium RIFOXYA12_FULL_61_12]OGT88454.1 MAG: hypothetical protein A2514_02185 [Gammaproteobacteria bacterium RIFOXYD12_FULL_61_37]